MQIFTWFYILITGLHLRLTILLHLFPSLGFSYLCLQNQFPITTLLAMEPIFRPIILLPSLQ